jgi:hypothetical protein
VECSSLRFTNTSRRREPFGIIGDPKVSERGKKQVRFNSVRNDRGAVKNDCGLHETNKKRSSGRCASRCACELGLD